jgi:hypothetical protein
LMDAKSFPTAQDRIMNCESSTRESILSDKRL